jgi:hypothetical protein
MLFQKLLRKPGGLIKNGQELRNQAGMDWRE